MDRACAQPGCVLHPAASRARARAALGLGALLYNIAYYNIL